MTADNEMTPATQAVPIQEIEDGQVVDLLPPKSIPGYRLWVRAAIVATGALGLITVVMFTYGLSLLVE